MIRESRNEKKLKAVLRAEFSLKQRLEKIDHEEDVILPKVNEFKALATVPELPSETIIQVDFDPGTDSKPAA